MKFDTGSTHDSKDSIYNINKQNLFFACVVDSSVIINDSRTNVIARSVTVKTQANAVDWNPQAPSYFVVVSDDTVLLI
jgi:hypothetical protein